MSDPEEEPWLAVEQLWARLAETEREILEQVRARILGRREPKDGEVVIGHLALVVSSANMEVSQGPTFFPPFILRLEAHVTAGMIDRLIEMQHRKRECAFRKGAVLYTFCGHISDLAFNNRGVVTLGLVAAGLVERTEYAE